MNKAKLSLAMRQVLESNPDLSMGGFLPAQNRMSLQKRDGSHSEMLTDEALDQFWRAIQWFQTRGRTIGLNKNITSYGLKHVVEKNGTTSEISSITGGYIANGILIAAGLALGLQHGRVPNSMNSYFDVTAPAIY
jgi:hypothetical protein